MGIRGFQRTVLARFVAAHDGESAADIRYPLLDDRGYRVDASAQATTHGPMVGIMADYPIIVRIDRSPVWRAPLFVESASPSDVALLAIADDKTDPALLASLADADPAHRYGLLSIPPGRSSPHLAIRSLRDADASPVVIRLRHESASGPVLAEMAVRPFSKMRVRVKPWLVRADGHEASFPVGADGSISGAPTLGQARHGTTSGFDVPAVLEQAKAIWAPSGIELTWQPADVAPGTIGHFHLEGSYADVVRDTQRFAMLHHRSRYAINVYFVQRYLKGNESPLGEGLNRDTIADVDAIWLRAFRSVQRTGPIPANANRPNTGIILARNSLNLIPDRNNPGTFVPMDHATDQMGHTLAHEIGHFLGLQHVVEPGPPPAAGGPSVASGGSATGTRHYLQAGGATILDAGGANVWQIMRLMYPAALYQEPDFRFVDFGYGAGGNPLAGYLLSMKHLPGVPEFDPTPECKQARDFYAQRGNGIYDTRNPDAPYSPTPPSP